MAYLVVPHEVSASTATIWIGAIDEPFDPGHVRLVSALGEHTAAAAWEHWGSREGDASPRLSARDHHGAATAYPPAGATPRQRPASS